MSTPTEIFKNILSSDNSLRKSAEVSLQQTKTLPFQSALSFYMEGISSEDSKISQLSALMFKKTLLDDNDYLKTQVSTEKAENLVNQVFYPLVNDRREWKFLERIGENIVKLYTICDLNKSFSQIVSLFNR